MVSENNNKTLTQSLNDQKLENQQMKMQKEADDKLDAARRRADQQIADYKRRKDAELAALAKNSPEVRAWMDMPVPPAIIALVRAKPTDPVNGAGGKGKDPGVKSNANPGAGVAPVPNKRPVAGVNPLIRK